MKQTLNHLLFDKEDYDTERANNKDLSSYIISTQEDSSELALKAKILKINNSLQKFNLKAAIQNFNVSNSFINTLLNTITVLISKIQEENTLRRNMEHKQGVYDKELEEAERKIKKLNLENNDLKKEIKEIINKNYIENDKLNKKKCANNNELADLKMKNKKLTNMIALLKVEIGKREQEEVKIQEKFKKLRNTNYCIENKEEKENKDILYQISTKTKESSFPKNKNKFSNNRQSPTITKESSFPTKKNKFSNNRQSLQMQMPIATKSSSKSPKTPDKKSKNTAKNTKRNSSSPQKENHRFHSFYNMANTSESPKKSPKQMKYYKKSPQEKQANKSGDILKRFKRWSVSIDQNINENMEFFESILDEKKISYAYDEKTVVIKGNDNFTKTEES